MVQTLSASELPSAVALLDRVGLVSAVANLARYLRWQPDGAWVEYEHGSLVGMVTLLRFGHVGFVGCMAVDPTIQGRGLGRALLEHAHAEGRRAGVTTFLLEATASGQRLYEKLGYLVDHETWMMTRAQVAPSSPGPLDRDRRDRDGSSSSTAAPPDPIAAGCWAACLTITTGGWSARRSWSVTAWSSMAGSAR
jgi:GNAT superfamily N-acetyltransferase